MTKYEFGEYHIDKATLILDPMENEFKYEYGKAGRNMSITTSYGT